MWELDHKHSWAPKNWCFWTVVLEKTLESPLDCKEIQPVHPKRNQSWIFIGKTDAEAETLILWPPDSKNWLIFWERPKAGGEEDNRGWDGWMALLTQWESEQALGVNDGQGSLEYCNPWGHKESDTTEHLNWTELKRGKRHMQLPDTKGIFQGGGGIWIFNFKKRKKQVESLKNFREEDQEGSVTIRFQIREDAERRRPWETESVAGWQVIKCGHWKKRSCDLLNWITFTGRTGQVG